MCCCVGRFAGEIKFKLAFMYLCRSTWSVQNGSANPKPCRGLHLPVLVNICLSGVDCHVCSMWLMVCSGRCSDGTVRKVLAPPPPPPTEFRLGDKALCFCVALLLSWQVFFCQEVPRVSTSLCTGLSNKWCVSFLCLDA